MIRPLLLAAGLASSVLFATPSTPRDGQEGPNSLSNFAAKDVSPTEVHVFVVYTYDGARGADQVSVTASAIQANGASVPGLVNDITRAMARIGTGRAVTVLRRESPGRPVTSTQIEVCLSHRFSGDILCRTFAHTRSWGDSTPPPTPDPPRPDPPRPPDTPPTPTPPAGTCTITGEVSGQLRWTSSSTRGGHPVTITSELRDMLMASRDGRRFTARLSGRQYVFSNVPAGQSYRITPGRFQAEPSSRSVDCRPNLTFRNVDFRITGGPHQ